MELSMKNGTKYSIDLCKQEQWDDAMELAFKVFLKYEAKQYGKKGTDNFAEFLTSPSLVKLFKAGRYVVYVATIGKEIIGIASFRSGNHISLLFVDDRYHRQGIAKQLIKVIQNHLLENTDYTTVTVHSSPYGIPFYKSMGFVATDTEIHSEGIIYTPMEMYL